jgi:hypothetical protein
MPPVLVNMKNGGQCKIVLKVMNDRARWFASLLRILNILGFNIAPNTGCTD